MPRLGSSSRPWAGVALLATAVLSISVAASRSGAKHELNAGEDRFPAGAAGIDGDQPAAGAASHKRDLKMTKSKNAFSLPCFTSIREFNPRLMSSGPPDDYRFDFNLDEFNHVCGAALVNSPQYGSFVFAVTAASCVSPDNLNPLVQVGATNSYYQIQRFGEEAAAWPNYNSPRKLPLLRTTYASYIHPQWNKQPGGPYDVALLVLDAQVPPDSKFNCVNCCTLAGYAPIANPQGQQGLIVGAFEQLRVYGMGARALNTPNPAQELQEITTKPVPLPTCRTARNPAPTGKWAKFQSKVGAIFKPAPVSDQHGCVEGLAPEFNGSGNCLGDNGNPVIWKSSDAVNPNYFVGLITRGPKDSCGETPDLVSDMFHARTWLSNAVRQLIAVPNLLPPKTPTANVAPTRTAAEQVLPTGTKWPLYQYGMRIRFLDRSSPAPSPPVIASCEYEGDDDGALLTLTDIGTPIAQAISSEFLEKTFFQQPKTLTNKYAVAVTQCQAGVVRFEWTSSKNLADQKVIFDSKLLPASDPSWEKGARNWALYFMCRVNREKGRNLMIDRFEIYQGNAVRFTLPAYTVNVTDWPNQAEYPLACSVFFPKINRG